MSAARPGPWLAVLLTAAWPAARPAAQEPFAPELLAADLDEISAAVRERWSYLDDHREHFGVDLDALVAAARRELALVRDADGWARVLRRFASGLQDGHAFVRVPGAREPARRLPLRVEPCAEGLVVTAVCEGAGVAPGALLHSLGGVPVAEAVAALEREECGSTPGMRRRLAITSLVQTSAGQVDVVLADPEGTTVERTLATIGAHAPVPPSRPPAPNWSLSWPRADTALLHLGSFTVPRWREWLEAAHEEREPFLVEARARIDALVAELRERAARGLIVDLRGNTGGTDELGIHLAERLLPGRFRYFLLSSRLEDGRWTPPTGKTYGRGDHARFTGPLVLLVDELSFSTTDNFARCVTDLHPDVTVVGRPSGGGTGAPRVLVTTTHTKAQVGACTMRVHGPRGRLIEGRGTEPDVPVVWTRADWALGRDPDVEAALQALR